MKPKRELLGLCSKAAYYARQYKFMGVALDTLLISVALVAMTILAWRGWRHGLAWWGWLAFAAGLGLVGLLYGLRFRRYTFFSPASWGTGGKAEPLLPEEAIRLQASGYLEVNEVREHWMGVPALFWITQLEEYILMAHVVLRKVPFLRPVTEEQGMWYAFIRPEHVTGVQAGYLFFGWHATPALQLAYLNQGEEPRALYLTCQGVAPLARLLQDILERSGLAANP